MKTSTPQFKHVAPARFATEKIWVDLVGVGGTGSLLLTELAKLHTALIACGHPHGLDVTVFDPDLVTEANIGRTSFAASDIGQYKAAVAVTRVNLHFPGLCWKMWPIEYTYPIWDKRPDRLGSAPDIVITCTDSLKSRVDLYRGMLSAEPPRYWLDTGNDAAFGQVILGQPNGWADNHWHNRAGDRYRLPHVVDVFPEMLENAEQEEPDLPSCSLYTALQQQELPINRHVASAAYELLWQLLRYGGLDWHGSFINTRGGLRSNPLPIGGTPATVREWPLDALPAMARRTRRLRSGSGGSPRYSARNSRVLGGAR